jgi:hypothetical protein
MEDIVQLKLIFLACLWIGFSPVYMNYKGYDPTLKNVAICLAPAIIFAVWFFVFYWG